MGGGVFLGLFAVIGFATLALANVARADYYGLNNVHGSDLPNLNLVNKEIRAQSPNKTHVSFEVTGRNFLTASDNQQIAHGFAVAVPKVVKNLKVTLVGMHTTTMGETVVKMEIPVLLKNITNKENGAKGIDSKKVMTDKGEREINFAPWNVSGEKWIDFLARHNLNMDDYTNWRFNSGNYLFEWYNYENNEGYDDGLNSTDKRDVIRAVEKWANARKSHQFVEVELFETGGGIAALSDDDYEGIPELAANGDVAFAYAPRDLLSENGRKYYTYNDQTGELALTEAGENDAYVESGFHNFTDYNLIALSGDSSMTGLTYRIEGDIDSGEEMYLPIRALPSPWKCFRGGGVIGSYEYGCQSLSDDSDFRFDALPRYDRPSDQEKLAKSVVGEHGFDTGLCRANYNGTDPWRDYGGDVNSNGRDRGLSYTRIFNLHANPAVTYMVAGFGIGDDGCEQALIHILPYTAARDVKENQQKPKAPNPAKNSHNANAKNRQPARKFVILPPNTAAKK